MPELPERKVGIVACSGEELAEGTVARLAALKVLHELRRGRTVTICLPLFLAGGEGDRAFASLSPDDYRGRVRPPLRRARHRDVLGEARRESRCQRPPRGGRLAGTGRAPVLERRGPARR